jgi:hypothetical protein
MKGGKKMRKEWMFILVILFALAFTFGCTGTGGKKNATTSGDAYTLNVNPRTVISGGVITIDLRLNNIFDNDMKELSASIKDLPSTFSGADEISGITIVKGQSYPVIWSIATPETDLKQNINPKVQVCFNYTTNFYFDTAVVPKTLATENVQLQSGYSNGPVSVSQMGLGKIFLKSAGIGYTLGSLDIRNAWQGKIGSINNITLTAPSDLKEGIKYAKCGGDTSVTITPDSGDCKILSNKLAIGDGIISTIKLNTTYAGDSVKVERTSGIIDYTYCYDVDIGDVMVCPVGQRC